jgi:pimeloyl-ACP methyl ester carboxylesterase
MAAEQPALHLLYRHIDDMNAHLDKEAVRARLEAGRTRAAEELTAAGCPILLVCGDEDMVMPPFAADAIAASFRARGRRISRMPDTPLLRARRRFNRLMEEFLAA